MLAVTAMMGGHSSFLSRVGLDCGDGAHQMVGHTAIMVGHWKLGIYLQLLGSWIYIG